jgi:hypothetical protein
MRGSKKLPLLGRKRKAATGFEVDLLVNFSASQVAQTLSSTPVRK